MMAQASNGTVGRILCTLKHSPDEAAFIFVDQRNGLVDIELAWRRRGCRSWLLDDFQLVVEGGNRALLFRKRLNVRLLRERGLSFVRRKVDVVHDEHLLNLL